MGVSLTPRRRYCVPLECLSRGLEGPRPRNKDLLSHTQPSPWGHGSLTRANREIRNHAENHGPFDSRARPIAIAIPIPLCPLFLFLLLRKKRFEWRCRWRVHETNGIKKKRRGRKRGKRETHQFVAKRTIDSRWPTIFSAKRGRAGRRVFSLASTTMKLSRRSGASIMIRQ